MFGYDITKIETFDIVDEWVSNVKESLGNENNYFIFLIEEGESKCKKIE